VIHRAAADGFSAAGAADAYERGRPPYPSAVIDRIADICSLRPGRVVVDLAAGTGRLTRLLLSSGARVIPVEPVAAMRAALPDAVEGTAESMPLPDASADAVTVGQAFHWFDGPAALREIARVLRPDGVLVLVWNAQNGLAPWIDRVLAVTHAANVGAAPQYATSAWRAAFDGSGESGGSGEFGPLVDEHVVTDWEVDAATVLDRFASVSYVAALPDAARADVLAAIRDVLDTDPATRGRERFAMPTRTDLYWCTKRS
jgi:SAM-dependent methyltransferase